MTTRVDKILEGSRKEIWNSEEIKISVSEEELRNAITKVLLEHDGQEGKKEFVGYSLVPNAFLGIIILINIVTIVASVYFFMH